MYIYIYIYTHLRRGAAQAAAPRLGPGGLRPRRLQREVEPWAQTNTPGDVKTWLE